MMLGRSAPDDGRHLPALVIAEDASVIAGAARYKATCSCGYTGTQSHATHEEALAEHFAHAATRLGPPAGPVWLPLGARLVILVSGMLLLWAGCFTVGQLLAQDLTGTFAAAVRAGSALAGLAAAGGLMVGVRRYIAPIRR
ncbi:hypothetical protein ACIGHB_29985 [Streptomyces sp. NPDC085460]|uniref:hypothetical protein n=1 Tax=Streptomyces sp. NPDC085460 TaxID=3365723 RepID=UPI0037CF65DF